MPRTTSILRSPIFWGGVVVAAVGTGIALHHKRGLLGRGSTSRRMGPTPVLIEKNPARMPTPASTTHAGGMTTKLYRSKAMSIDERLKLIQGQVWKGVADPQIRELAGQLTKNCGRDDGPCEVKRVYDAVKAHVRYSGDIGPVLDPSTGKVEAIDLYQSPYRTWKMQIADCDDHTALIASLLAVMGHTVRLRVSAPSRFSEWAHIYPVVGVPKTDPRAWKSIGAWKAVDVTLPWRGGVGSEARYGKARDYNTEVPA